MRFIKHRAVVIAMFCCLVTPGRLGAAWPWWKVQWPHRRAVTIISAAKSALDGADIAVFDMPTAGATMPDGADVRMATFGGMEVAARVLMDGPGDRVKVAFAVRPKVTRYFVYFGNPEPGRRQAVLEIKRGVLLSTWAYPGGGTGTLRQVRRVFGRARKFLGRDFRSRIFLGHNPFGPQRSIASTFEAYLMCPDAGKYVFSTSSQNSSFLLIDDLVVVDNHGFHRPQRNVARQGSVDLSAGMHKLTFYHVSARGDPIVVVAWQRPGESEISVIEPRFFAPVARANVGVMETRGKPSVDFIPVHADESVADRRYYQRYTFRADGFNLPASAKQWRWNFGDGLGAEAAEVGHVYLKSGTYPVTLTCTLGKRTFTRTNRIYVTRPWDKVIARPAGSVRRHADIVASYDFTELRTSLLGDAAVLLQRAKRRQALLDVGRAMLKRKSLPGPAAAEALPLYADALVADGAADKAVDALIAGAKLTADPASAAALQAKAGHICLVRLDEPARAMEIFQQVIRKFGPLTSAVGIRRARIGLGDSWRIAGDHEKSRQAYLAAGSAPAGRPGREAFVRGDLARHVEDYTRRRLLTDARTTLDQWAEVFPADKLDGYWSLMEVRLLTAQKRYASAAREATVLVAVNPTSHHSPMLLWLGAKALRLGGETTKARAMLARLIEEYPETQLAVRARTTLETAGGEKQPRR